MAQGNCKVGPKERLKDNFATSPSPSGRGQGEGIQRLEVILEPFLGALPTLVEGMLAV